MTGEIIPQRTEIEPVRLTSYPCDVCHGLVVVDASDRLYREGVVKVRTDEEARAHLQKPVGPELPIGLVVKRNRRLDESMCYEVFMSRGGV